MNNLSKKILILLMGMLILSLSACGRIRDVVPGLGSFNRPTVEATDVASGEGYNDLVNALRAAGAEVSAAGRIEQPFFPVVGQVIDIDGTSVQVFEFEDQSTRQQVSDTISASGDEIGRFMPGWIDQPNFWASGRLIVLYLGEDQTLIELLSSVLGNPITEPGEAVVVGPEAILKGQRLLAQELNVEFEAVKLIEYEQVEWTDGCLGLGRPDEGCITVITPGWRAIFEVDEKRFEVRTDESGDNVRWQQLDEGADAGKAFIYLVALESSDGEVIGCGDALVPVEITLQNTVQPIRDALNAQLSLHDQYYGESGLYNALYQSNLTVDSVMLDSSNTVTVNMSGELLLGGTCDVPRFQAQLERTVTQFPSVNAVKFFLNGKPLDEILSGAGESFQSADYEGISFVVPSSLAGEVSGANVPASAAGPGIPFVTQIPEHILFEFTGYADVKTSLQPQIRVVPAEKLLEIQPRAGNLIALLRTIIAIKPELLIEYMRLLPFVDTSEMMFAQVQAVEFQNGMGVRFLTQYNPGRQPVNNTQLFYTYHGLTNDGKYYVAAILPVSHAVLPDTSDAITGEERAEFERDYPAYLVEITRKLNGAPASSFTPDLFVLDQMIASLQIPSLE
jgi:hypothetical protein